MRRRAAARPHRGRCARQAKEAGAETGPRPLAARPQVASPRRRGSARQPSHQRGSAGRRRRPAPRGRSAHEQGGCAAAGRVGVAERVVSGRGQSHRAVEDGGATGARCCRTRRHLYRRGVRAGRPVLVRHGRRAALRRTPDGFSRSALPVRRRVVAIAPDGPQTAVVTVESGQPLPHGRRRRHLATNPVIREICNRQSRNRLQSAHRLARFPPSSVLPMKAPYPAPRRSEMRFSIPLWRRATGAVLGVAFGPAGLRRHIAGR